MDAALGGALVAVFTQLLLLAAGQVAVALPAWAKQGVALLVSVGVVQGLHPFSHLFAFGVDYAGLANTLVVWAASTFLHDVASAAAPKG